jgi:hypothetical protein
MVAESLASTLLQVLVRHRAFGGGADELRVFGEDAAGFFGREGSVGFHPGGVVGFGDEQAHRVFHGVDLDEVTGFAAKVSEPIANQLAAFKVNQRDFVEAGAPGGRSAGATQGTKHGGSGRIGNDRWFLEREKFHG